MEILKPNQLKEKFNDPWIAPYQKVLTMVDGNKVEIVEFHPCISGSHWLLHQYKNNSDLIDSAYRDGNKHVYSCHIGCAPLDLKASFNAAGIDEIVVDGDEVKVTHAGLAGAGVGAGMCRGMGEGVKYIELLEEGGGSKVGRARVVTPKLEKVVIGVDDTDVKDAGATWTMAHNLGVELKNEGFEYLDHVIVQLYPHNPHKTQNCVSIALTFAVPEDKKEELIELEGFGSKSVSNLLISIENSKNNSLENLLNGLGINGIGAKTAKILAKKYETMDNLMNASSEELEQIKDIGSTLSNNISNYFDNPKNRILIHELKDIGINMEYKGEKIIQDEAFTNKKFVLTGTISFLSRDELKKIIEDRGGEVSGSVSKKTDVVIAGENPGSKYDKAKALNIPIWDEVSLRNYLGE